MKEKLFKDYVNILEKKKKEARLRLYDLCKEIVEIEKGDFK